MSAPPPVSTPPVGGNGGGDDKGRLTPTEPQAQDAYSVLVARVSGIPIRLHFTFLLLLVYAAATGIGRGGAGMVLFLLGLFLCVVLHELGHSVVAQRFGYKVRDIVLYPIGGVASIENSPRPRHELFIAVAGPAVNVVIAGVLYVVMAFRQALPTIAANGGEQATNTAMASGPLALLFYANVGLVAFNMIPAFPMDGGRVLRALLALRIGKTNATKIAARVGQGIALLMALYCIGLLGSPFEKVPFVPQPGNISLILIALFVFFGAGQEAQAEQAREVVEHVPVESAMVRTFQTLQVGDSLRRAAEVLLATTQQDFPVVHGSETVGVLSRGALLRGLAEQGETAYVAGAMERNILFAKPTDELEQYMVRSDGVQRCPVLVNDENGALVGMLTADNLMEFLTLRSIARARAEQDAATRGEV